MMRHFMFGSILSQSWISLQLKSLLSILPSPDWVGTVGNAETSWTTKMRRYACFIIRVMFDVWLIDWKWGDRKEEVIIGFSWLRSRYISNSTKHDSTGLVNRFLLHRNLAFNFLICLTRNVFKLSMSSLGSGRYPPLRADKDWDLASENPMVHHSRNLILLYFALIFTVDCLVNAQVLI